MCTQIYYKVFQGKITIFYFYLAVETAVISSVDMRVIKWTHRSTWTKHNALQNKYFSPWGFSTTFPTDQLWGKFKNRDTLLSQLNRKRLSAWHSEHLLDKNKRRTKAPLTTASSTMMLKMKCLAKNKYIQKTFKLNLEVWRQFR